ncbi:hypothetical protein BDY19DRAFT_987305 [Irpex rosettiformis]|uniref:Uncharacterized protein n=1 Tax=Irpex rosettiformis TaxID=378272 RepID=A0ACB8TS41_9APHY|nr:hypothetical protein BDY19DRAFT_987305 [Irpex rosettiformis]
MANVATMGPPPSPKEPRRSGRRSVPSHSMSKSPGGSPTSESAPKSKDSTQRQSLSTNGNLNRSKRAKNEDVDVTLEEIHKNGITNATNGRSKRKGKEKEKEKTALTVEVPADEDPAKVDVSVEEEGELQEEEEEEQGVTRCICHEAGMDGSESGEFMVECDKCHAWQHGNCMGYATIADAPADYFCEKCRPDLWQDLILKYAKRIRQNSAASGRNVSRNSRSHSPNYSLKQPPKRRNTMNSRDAAYEQQIQALIESTAAEADAAKAAVTSPKALTVVIPESKGPPDVQVEPEIVSASRRKRKRPEDDAVTSKRPRSASIVSDRTHIASANPVVEPSPITTKPAAPPPPTTNPTTTKTTGGRAKRGGARKAQAHLQDVASGDCDEAANTASVRRQMNSRSKASASHEHGSRRTHANGVNGVTSHNSAATSSRNYHSSHGYNVSQQPLYTSWHLPDYLSHLEPMLPTNVPRPLEVRGFSAMPNGSDVSDRTTERGVKVKWPSKRMSVGDMNKRVRSLVEWVGREQASAMERSRRREAVENGLRENRAARLEGVREGEEDASRPNRTDSSTVPLNGASTESPQDLRTLSVNGHSSSFLDGPGSDSGAATMKMMEELMEELISFQERFGPGAKFKERERRTVAVAS